MGDRKLLNEQIRYYRARASEYDATSPGGHDPFEPDLDQARRALRAFAPRGRVLELAAGTGLWTGILADLADELVATDASPEMLALNRGKVGERRNVRYEVADAFDPGGEAFNVIFFGFFLSHVPHDRFDAFWATLRRRLAPGGRVFFVDEAEHGLWREDWIDEGAGIVRRTLTDGTEHRAVKVLWRPEALGTRLIGLGWHAAIQASGPFYWGSGVPISPG